MLPDKIETAVNPFCQGTNLKKMVFLEIYISNNIYTTVATVREKYLENDFFYRSGKSQGSLWMAREI